jgi:hypothetical protein
MTHDSDYFRRRAEEARAAACSKEFGASVEAAGDLALAYAALARRRARAAASEQQAQEDKPAIPLGELA